MTERTLAGLERALFYAGGTHTVGDVARAIVHGEAQIHTTEDDSAVIVTELQDYPRMRVCHFWLATGEKKAVVELSRAVLKWAKEHGCKRATLAGRRGWERVLASEGWTPTLTLMGREV